MGGYYAHGVAHLPPPPPPQPPIRPMREFDEPVERGGTGSLGFPPPSVRGLFGFSSDMPRAFVYEGRKERCGEWSRVQSAVFYI